MNADDSGYEINKIYRSKYTPIKWRILKETEGTDSNPNPHACKDTDDRVFLLSYREATNADYGLNTTAARVRSTDYAQAQGCGANCSCRIRSPHKDFSDDALYFKGDGNLNSGGIDVYNTTMGILSALALSLQ